MKTTFIYSLSDPITKEVKYIGKANKLNYRLWSHLFNARNSLSNLAKCQWIKSLTDQGLIPVIEELEEVPTSNWMMWEEFWISQFRIWGFDLFNMTNGGHNGLLKEKKNSCAKGARFYIKKGRRGHIKGSFKHSEETKQKIREKRALQIVTEEHKNAISNKMKGVKKSKSHINNISKGRKGITFTEEHKENIRKSKLNY